MLNDDLLLLFGQRSLSAVLNLNTAYPLMDRLAYGHSADGKYYYYGSNNILVTDPTLYSLSLNVTKTPDDGTLFPTSYGASVAATVAGSTIAKIFTTSIDDLIFVVVLKTATGNYYLLRSADGGGTFTNVLTFGAGNGTAGADSINVLTSNVIELTRNLPGGTGLGNLYVGEYNVNASRTPGSTNDRVRLMVSTDQGANWTVAALFNNDGSNNNIRHIHNVKQDPDTGYLYILTGDTDAQSGIIRWDGASAWPNNVSLTTLAGTSGFSVLHGNQGTRSMDLIFTSNYIYWMTDTGGNDPTNLYSGIWRGPKDLSSSVRLNSDIFRYDPYHSGWFGVKIGNLLYFLTAREAGWTKQNIQIYGSADNGQSWRAIGELALASAVGSVAVYPEIPIVVSNKLLLSMIYAGFYISSDLYNPVVGAGYKILHPETSLQNIAQSVFKVTVTNGQSITPKYTFYTGAPSATVDWGDGSAPSAVTSGVALNHTYPTGGTYLVSLVMNYQQFWVKELNFNSCHGVGSEFVASLAGLTCLKSLDFDTNAFTGTLALGSLPTAIYHLSGVSNVALITTGNVSSLPYLTLINTYGCANALAFSLADIPKDVTFVRLTGANLVISGSLSSLICTKITYLYMLNATSSTITGGSNPMVTTLLQTLNLASMAINQAGVDSILARLATDVALFTYAYPTITLNGTDAAPSNPAGLASKAILTTALWTVNTN